MATDWTIGSYTLENCDTYFDKRGHMSGRTWFEFDEADREAALRQAEIQIYLFIGRDLTPVEIYDQDYRVRHDYAVYEQALHLLFTVDIPNGERSGAKWLSDDSSNKSPFAEGTDAHYISPRAKLWLGLSLRNPIISRG